MLLQVDLPARLRGAFTSEIRWALGLKWDTDSLAVGRPGPQGSSFIRTAVAAVQRQYRERSLQHVRFPVSRPPNYILTVLSSPRRGHVLIFQQARGGKGGGAARVEGALGQVEGYGGGDWGFAEGREGRVAACGGCHGGALVRFKV